MEHPRSTGYSSTDGVTVNLETARVKCEDNLDAVGRKQKWCLNLAKARSSPVWTLGGTVPPCSDQQCIPCIPRSLPHRLWVLILGNTLLMKCGLSPSLNTSPLPSSIVPPITASTLTCLFTWFCGFNLDVVTERCGQRKNSPPHSPTFPYPSDVPNSVSETRIWQSA